MSISSGPVVIAAGGGGDGCSGSAFTGFSTGQGGIGGAAGADGGAALSGNAQGGKAGTSTAGGAGGAGGTGMLNGNPGAAGSAGKGGDGGNRASGGGASGGGGGGGLYGGGGGGQGAIDTVNGSLTTEPGGGGGGGTSLVPPGGSLGTVTEFPPAPATPQPMVVLSYAAPAEIPTSPGALPPGVIRPPGSPGSGLSQGAARVRMTGVSQSHARWRPGNKLTKIAAIARVRRPPVGTTFRVRLSGSASVRFAFMQSLPGRRVGGRCSAQTATNLLKRRCWRTVTAGSFRFSAGVGGYSVRFQGRISRSKKLKPGRYTLIITATNTAGSSTARLRFTIVS